MFDFRKAKKRNEAQRFLARIINNECSLMDRMREGPREEPRINLAVVAVVVPMQHGKPRIERAFATVTREVSTSGLCLVLQEKYDGEELIVGIQTDEETQFIRTEVRHQEPLAAGMYQIGVAVIDPASERDFPELAVMEQFFRSNDPEPIGSL